MRVTQISCWLFCLLVVSLAEPPCVIELSCPECLPDNMPLITSHRASPNSSITAATGDEVVLACYGGKFFEFPLHEVLTAVCEEGKYRVRQDGTLRHLLELGCQENIFEDVLHQVEYCGPPMQGRAYQQHESTGGRVTRHLATLCFDEDRAIALRAHVTNAPRNQMRMPEHSDARTPLSLLGNFNHMFDAKTRSDAEKLYSDGASLNRRLRELFRHERFSFASQTLTGAGLLSTLYFDDQDARVAQFVSGQFAAWASVAEGNLRHLQRDVAKYLKLSRPHAALDLFAGTHGVQSLRTGHSRTEIYLKAGRRFPVPKYLWTVVHDAKAGKAISLVLLKDPFVAVSEIRDAVFCESVCGRVSWLHELKRNRNYESPLYGLVFCCPVHDLAEVVEEMPKEVLKNVFPGNAGLLVD